MRSGRSIVIALLASTFWLVPINVIAQQATNGFLILSNPKELLKAEVTVVKGCKVNDGKVSCTVDTSIKPCSTTGKKYGLCSSALKEPVNPSVAVYGVAGSNTCYWVWHDGVMYKYGQC